MPFRRLIGGVQPGFEKRPDFYYNGKDCPEPAQKPAMQIHRKVRPDLMPASACAMGMFDGVHLGHRMILENAIRRAKIMGIPSVVFSFANHPQTLLAQTPTQVLSNLEERLAQFESLGFDHALILDFTPGLRELSAETFIQDILVNTLHVEHVTVGYDHRFGENRSGNGELLKELGEVHGFEVDIIQPVKVAIPENQHQIVSSTLIRKLLSYGDIHQANQLLGRPYSLTGPVIQGFQRGRQLGFPTANLSIESNHLVPALGTYSGMANLKGKDYVAVCNIGHAPTFEESTALPRIEVHLLDYSGPDFYGAHLTFAFTQRLRQEMTFPTVDALIAQIHKDCEQAFEISLKHTV